MQRPPVRLTNALLCFLTISLLLSCRGESSSKASAVLADNQGVVSYAKGFRIYTVEGGHLLELRQEGADHKEGTWIALSPSKSDLDRLKASYFQETGKQIVSGLVVPVPSVVSNSTTHVAALELIGELERLRGFAQTRLVSSRVARHLIASGHIREIGMAGGFDPERLLELRPTVILTAGPAQSQKELRIPERQGTFVLPIMEWLEPHPLGRAEWIKVFGLLTGRYPEATERFAQLERRYQELKHTPTSSPPVSVEVISGSLFQDVFYAPGGSNWMAVLIRDAGGSYIWSEHAGNQSLQLSAEMAVQQGLEAPLWLGCGQYGDMEELRTAHPLLDEIKAVKDGQVFTYMNHRGETGGVLFFEEAVYRPDLLLEDARRILETFASGAEPTGLHYFSKLAP